MTYWAATPASPKMRTEQLEALRGTCPGSASGNLARGSAVEAVCNGLTGDIGTKAALQSALEGIALRDRRRIQTRYLREADPRSAGFVRARLDAASKLLDFSALASEVLAPATPFAWRSVILPRQTGVDQGPKL